MHQVKSIRHTVYNIIGDNNIGDILNFKRLYYIFKAKSSQLSENIYAVNIFPSFSRAVESLHVHIISEEVVDAVQKVHINWST